MLTKLWRYPLLAAIFVLFGTEAGHCGFLDDLIPTVEVTLDHPPSLGLSVDRVAFARSQGDCSEEFIAMLIEDFVHNQVEVIERERLDEILEEINLSVSGYIDQEDALAIGQILGPSALMFVDVHRCQTNTHRSYKSFQTKKGTYRTYYSTTEMSFKCSLRIVDLTTGRIFSAKTVEETAEQTASSNDGYPEYPPEYELHDLAIRRAATQVHRMFFPWRETRSLRYYKDDNCNLQTAYDLLKIGDLEGAAEQSEKNLEYCKSLAKVKPKSLARAYYNVGMSHFMRDEHDKALEYFEEAYRLKSGSRIQETILECRRALEEAEKMRQYETRMELAARAEPAAIAAPAPSRAEEPSDTSIADRLHELEELKEQGLLTDEEYQAKKQEILADL